MNKPTLTRRYFLMGSLAVATGCATGRSARRVSPNEKMNIAGIGAGGKGEADITGCESENIVAMADVDERQAGKMRARFPKAKFYRDYREMLEKERGIDGVTVSVPDHSHAHAAMAAMELGKHVYVQKPLTRTIHEARALTRAAKRYNVVTQMGNQGHSGDGVRELCEMIWTGAIGQVREAHIWTDRPIWPQGRTRPAGSDPVPPHLDWDLWLGPAKDRPFVDLYPGTTDKCYHPFVWRGWWDFGCGALGDMACHIADPANWALKLTSPTSVEVVMQEGMTADMAPNKSTLKYEFPARGDMQAVTIYWYDGGNLPARPEGIGAVTKLGDGGNGSLFIGDKGYISSGTYGGGSRLLPEPAMQQYTKPPQMIERVPEGDHYMNWIDAIKNGTQANSNFDYAGPFTEWVLLGNLALRTNSRIEWDAANMKVTNVPEANQYITSEYRKGWSL